MVLIELTFPAGRYHATPWGRNVNEGEIEWPPSPYRLARALVDTWKRRRPEWEEDRVSPIIEALAAPAKFHLPPATSSHTRSFLHSNEKDPSKKQLIFDAFVVLERSARAILGLDLELTPSSLEDLDELLQELNYLGRSESWICARLLGGSEDFEWNCIPIPSSHLGKGDGDSVVVACLRTPHDYSALAHRPDQYEVKGKKLSKTGKACSWLDAICLDTRRLLNEGWSHPPALAWITYERRIADFGLTPVRTIALNYSREVRCIRYAMVSNVLPRLTDTAPIAERVRQYLMGIHRRILNDDPSRVSWRFSGKDTDGNPLKGHSHAFYLPMDEDGDGRLDHLWIVSRDPFEETELRALDRLRSIWQSDGRPDLKLVLTSLGETSQPKRARQWASVTPFVTARHYRKGRGSYPEWLDSEIRRECEFHGLPASIEIQWIPHTLHTSHAYHWLEFVRGRKGQSPLRGQGCILSFAEETSGPFALGAGCHYGLGLFMPLDL